MMKHNQKHSEDRPLVTFALLAYNQEAYVQDAIEGALKQTYTPLEIILSDDASTDSTYSIINELAVAYIGLHQIIKIRNSENLGISEHINKIFAMAKGDLIVLAAGDDISVPDRVEKIVAYWIENKKQQDLIWSDVNLIDESGRFIKTIRSAPSKSPEWHQIKEMVPAALGCAFAVTKNLFSYYGPLDNALVYEDRVLAFRGLCLGGLGHIPETLVNYRTHKTNIHNIAVNYKSKQTLLVDIEKYRLDHQRKIVVFSSYIDDLDLLIKRKMKLADPHKLMRAILTEKAVAQTDALSISPEIKDRWKALVSALSEQNGGYFKKANYTIRLFSPKLSFIIKKYKYKIIRYFRPMKI